MGGPSSVSATAGTEAGPPVLAFFEYAYDAEGHRISQTTAEGVERYTYDAVGQLTDVIYPDGSEEHFTYDAVGNRIAHTGTTGVSPVEETYTANNLNQYTTISGGPTSVSAIEYDLDGNMTRKGDTRYYYNCEDRLVGVTNETTGVRWSCDYDVFGNRVMVDDNGTVTEKLYVQGSLPSVAAEFDDAGAISTHHILIGSTRLADWESRHLGGGDENTIRYYHSDGLASTRLLTDATGAVTARASYNAFGSIRSATGESITDGWVGTLGVERDSTGLLFMRNRYYDPAAGRFTQRDPIGHVAGDVNWYRYCGNDGISGIDPLGLDDFGDYQKSQICKVQYAATGATLGIGFSAVVVLGTSIASKKPATAMMANYAIGNAATFGWIAGELVGEFMCPSYATDGISGVGGGSNGGMNGGNKPPNSGGDGRDPGDQGPPPRKPGGDDGSIFPGNGGGKGPYDGGDWRNRLI